MGSFKNQPVQPVIVNPDMIVPLTKICYDILKVLDNFTVYSGFKLDCGSPYKNSKKNPERPFFVKLQNERPQNPVCSYFIQ
jgi:hypothetical protein